MKKKSITVLVMLLLVSTIILSGCGQKEPVAQSSAPGAQAGTPASSETITLNLAHYATKDHPLGMAADYFAKKVEEKSNGRIKVQVYPANSLGAPNEICEQVRLGTLDMSLNTGGQLSQYVPEYNAIQLPFIWDGPEHVYKVLDGEGGKMLADLALKQNFVVLSNWDWGFRHITNSKRPINTPEDLKGLKLRVPPEKSMEVTIRALGAIPTSVSYSELYMALSQGVVDGEENPLLAIYTEKFYEPNKNVALVGYMYNNAVHLISKNTWDKIPDDLKPVITEASAEARDYMRDLMLKDEEKIKAELEAKGVKFTTPDLAPFKKAVEPAIEELKQSIGEDFYKQWMEVVEKNK